MSPWRPATPCGHPGCSAHAVLGTGRCEVHKRDRWVNRLSVTERGYGHAWRKVRERILVRDQHTCTSCGQPASQVDHLVPKHKGGTDDEGNLVSLCRRCHDRKTGREGQASSR
jgi:5-methylcytosine-specific restriction protein A